MLRVCAVLVVGAGFAMFAQGCGSSPGQSGTQLGGGGPTGSNETTGGDGGAGASTGSTGGATSGGGSSTVGEGSSGSGDNETSGSGTGSSSGGTTTASGDGGPAVASNPEGGVSEKTDAAPPAMASCTKGQVTPDEVVMIGDSYMDKNFGNVGANIIADAQQAGSLAAGVTYREYYLAGAAMNNGSGQLNIPYQYETMALGDLTVTNPKDIKVVIMDGGGNDVLIDQRSCLTDATEMALTSDTACMTAVSGSVNRTKQLWQEMAGDGVKQIVYYFYPHLNPAGGGYLTTPAPGVNLVDDYSAPLYQEACCGSSFTPTTTDYSCTGNAPGTQCVYIDTRPAFDGHSGAAGEPGPDYILTDMVHPNAMGSVVIANLTWDAMKANCVAQ